MWLKDKKSVGGMLMAAVLVMGLLSRASFREAAGQVTLSEEVIRQCECRLFVNGEEHEAKPGVYTNAMLLVVARYAREGQQTKLGEVQAAEEQYYGLYVDA